MNLTANLYLKLIRGGAAALAARRQEINDLNVFPIPDGDTGDNMFMTIDAGASVAPSSSAPQSLSSAPQSSSSGLSRGSLSATSDAVSHAMLLGARGNSGVILSRIFAGLAKGFAGLEEADIAAFDAAGRGLSRCFPAR